MSFGKQGRVTLDEQTWGELERIALKKGISKSEIIENYINRGLAKEPELETFERMQHADKVLNLALDSMLSLLNIEVKEGFRRKFEVLFTVFEGISRKSYLYSRKGAVQIGIFNLLREIQSYDDALFREMGKELKGNLKQTYLSLYPENKT